MKKIALILVVVLGLFLMGSSVWMGLNMKDDPNTFYEGDVVCYTELDYTMFVSSVAHAVEMGSSIREMDILRGNQVTVVSFDIEVPENYIFSYGERGAWNTWIIMIPVFLIGVFLLSGSVWKLAKMHEGAGSTPGSGAVIEESQHG